MSLKLLDFGQRQIQVTYLTDWLRQSGKVNSIWPCHASERCIQITCLPGTWCLSALVISSNYSYLSDSDRNEWDLICSLARILPGRNWFGVRPCFHLKTGARSWLILQLTVTWGTTKKARVWCIGFVRRVGRVLQSMPREFSGPRTRKKACSEKCCSPILLKS